MSRYIVTDQTWREPFTRPRGWIIVASQMEADSNARLIDRLPATTLNAVASYVWRRSTFTIATHVRKLRAAIHAYRDAQ